MVNIKYAQTHIHSKYSVNPLSGEGVLHKRFWKVERPLVKFLMSSPCSLVKQALKKGIDYIFITDHNTVPEIENCPSLQEHMFKGEEWGQRKGHSSFLNLNKSIDPECGYFEGIEPENPKDFREAFEEAKAQNAFIVINHPFKSDSWEWGDEAYYMANAIEIWNSNWNLENQKALEKWQSLLENGVRIYAMAGNDFHIKGISRIDFQIIASYNTNDKNEFFKHLIKGEYSLSLNTSSPIIFLEKDNEVIYHIEKFEEGLEMRIHTRKRHYKINNVDVEGYIKIEEGDDFVRSEIWKNSEPLSFSNPIFLKNF